MLSIPKTVEEIATKERFDLGFFVKNIGILDKSRFPLNTDLWPSPNHLLELNSI